MFATSRIIFALAVLCVCNGGFGDENSIARTPGSAGLAFQLEPAKITPGERARFTVALPLASVGLADVDEETELPTLRDDLLLETEELQVLDRDFRRERDHLIWTFDVTAHKDGKYNLPPLEVRHGGQTFSTEATPLTVKSNRAPGDEALRPDYEGMGSPWRWKRWLAILGLLALLFVLWKKSLHQRRLVARLVSRSWHRFRRWFDEPAPESLLRWEIEACHLALTAGHPPAGVLDRASRAVRFYLSRRRENAANAWTTEELRRHAQLANATLERAFVDGDATKFAPGETEAREVTERLLAAAKASLMGPKNEIPARGEAYLRAARRWLLARLPATKRSPR